MTPPSKLEALQEAQAVGEKLAAEITTQQYRIAELAKLHGGPYGLRDAMTQASKRVLEEVEALDKYVGREVRKSRGDV